MKDMRVALAGLLLALLVVLAVQFHFLDWAEALFVASLGAGILGTVTVAYTFPGTGAPTAALAYSHSMVVATVDFSADTDSTGTITHNFKTTLAEGSNLFPIVTWRLATPGTGATIVGFVLTDSSTVTLTKAATAGSASSIVVTLLRPHTIIR